MSILYGFDKVGYKLPNQNQNFRDHEIQYCKYGSIDIEWNKVDGLIIPSGVFETFIYQSVNTDEKTLLEIENEAYNLIREKKWITILALEKFVIKLGYDKTIYETDLSKKIIKSFGSDIEHIKNPFPVNETEHDQFRNYLKHYGVAKNVFNCKGSYTGSVNVIAGEWRRMYAYEQSQLLFVLPFHSTKKSEEDLKKASISIVESICDYISVKKKELPEWVHKFQFKKEENLIIKYKELTENLESIKNEISILREYKLSLTTTGDNLRNIIIKILQNFFKVQVDPIDENLEDFKIIDGEDVKVFGEVKGTKKGVKREHINQVDSHRERAEVNNEITGLLIINNQMNIASLAKRNETVLAKEHIRHAKLLNVVIMRTIDLLNMMKLQELDDSKNLLMNSLRNGGGWLKVDETEIKLISE